MKKNLVRIITVLIVLQMAFGTIAYADYTNVQYVDAEQSRTETIVYEQDGMYLQQDWYGTRFEVNPSNTVYGKTLKAVNQKEYKAAIENVKFDVSLLGDYKVYFLDYKLKNYRTALALSFADDTAVVFGTSSYMTRSKIHRLATHELGHQVDFQLMDEQKWQEYIAIRGLQDEEIYNDNSQNHKNRPQEIFAEDFRLMCGDRYARINSHENKELSDPRDNPELVAFFENLSK